jgi:phage protein U
MALFQLGEKITFETTKVVPQTVSVKKNWRWAVQERIMRAPARQRIGPGDDVQVFTGVIFPMFSVGGQPVGGKQLKVIESEADKMEPMMLNDGRGKIYGRYCILDLEEEKEYFVDNGAPRKQSFTLTLGKYFEDEPGFSSGVSTDGMTGGGMA